MMHSSSWPDRAAQTVKMRIDPLSRAFTIIPTSRETVYRLEQTAPRSDYLEEVILLDRCVPKGIASVMIKRKLVDGRPSINKKPTNSAENSSDVNNETKKRKNTSRYFMPRSLSSIETTAVHQNGIIVLEENIFRDQSRCKSDFFAKIDEAKQTRDATKISLLKTTSDTMTDIAKLFPKNSHAQEEPVNAATQLTNKSPSFETNAFDVIVNVANERLHAASIAQVDNSQTRETDGVRKECQIAISPTSSPRHSMSSPPHIKVNDYDDYATSVSFSSKGDRHVCTKCTSEGLLRSQIDPFRSPSRTKRNATATKAHDFRRDDSIKREKEEAYDKRRDKDIWYAGCLIGEAKKLDRQSKNDGLCPARPAIDFRKEATLGRHYYPEGGWGYVIVTCSVLVHFIGVGLQLAAPGCWHITAERKFRHPPLHSAGKKSNILNSH